MVELFSIQCTTCKSRLKVRNATIIGDIVACPKCGSMVLVEAPEDWQPTAESPQPTNAKSTAAIVATNVALPKPKKKTPAKKKAARNGAKKKGKPVAKRDGAAPFTAGPPANAEPAFDQSGDTIDGSQANLNPGNLPASTPSETGVPPALPTSDPPKAPNWTADTSAPVRQIAMVVGASVMGLILALGLFVTAIRIFSSPNEPVQVSQDGPATDAQTSPDSIPRTDGNTPSIDGSDGDQREVVKPEDGVEPPSDDSSAPSDDSGPVVVPPVTVDGEDPTVSPGDGTDPVTPPLPVPTDATEPEIGDDEGEDPFNNGDPKEPTPKDPPAGTDLADDPLLSRFADFIDASPTEGTRVEEPTDEEPASTDAIDDEAEFTRPSAITIDVEKHLGDPIAAIDFPAAKVASFADFMADFMNTPITIDPTALRDVQASPGTALSINLKETTARAAINKALEPLKLAVVAREKDGLFGYPASDETPPTRTFAIADLAPGDADKNRLRTLVTELIEPDSWEFNGGDGDISIEGDELVVKNRPEVLFRTLVLLEKLRNARGLKLVSPYASEYFQLAPRSEQATPLLNTKLTMNYGHGERLTTILQRIHETTDLWVLVDWESAAKEGWHHLAKVELIAHEEPVGDALDRLAHGMGLSVRVIDREIVQLVAHKDLTQRFDVEFYSLSDRFKEPAETLLNEIRSEIGEGSFQPVGKGAIHYDENSRTILVSLPQPQQKALAAFLNAKASE